MKTKTSKNPGAGQLPAVLGLLPGSSLDTITEKSKFNGSKNLLRRSIQLALAGSVLASGMAAAVLQDHGPADPTLTWPLWYRDTNGLALSECLSQVPSPNALAGGKAMCFPKNFDPNGFAGNIGPELFYNMVGFVDKNTGSDFHFRYVAGLEGSYLPLGVPVHGTETVFARVRVGLNFNDPNKNGTYTVTHPYGVETFQNVKATNTQNLFGKGTAIFFTADIPLAAPMNFDGALKGAVGPFVQWDVLQAGESLTTADGTKFLGDPNFPHTFTGSPFGTNFIRIEGPPGSNLDGLGTPTSNIIQINTATILGQVWGAPIAQPLAITAAYETRSTSGLNAIDIWATSSPNQNLIVTGKDLPSLQLFPSGTTQGLYHGHIEYSGVVPATVTVTNLTSIPIASTSSALIDGVEISRASFDTATRALTIVAASSDQVEDPGLVLEGVPGVPSAAGVIPAVTSNLTQLACSAVINPVVTDPADRCFVYTLPATIEPPESVSVISTDLGAHADHLVSSFGGPQNPLNPPVAADILGAGFSVNTGGSTPLTGAGPLPLDALIIQQPAIGTVALLAGVWTYTATPGAIAGPDSFQYVRQAGNNAPVSNVATANLTLLFNSTAPTAVADQFAATTSPAGARKLFLLSNDKAFSANPLDQLDPASVTIVAAPARGTLVTNADGTISYTATSGGSDSFTYTVKNKATPAQTSNTATVTLTNFTGPESNSVGKVTYTVAKAKWTIIGGTNWFGPNLTQSTATCWTGTDPAATASTLIGSSPLDATGKYAVVSQGAAPPVVVNGQPIRCQTSYGAIGAATTVTN